MERKASRAHCLVLAYPGQGHINPMLQFCKRLEYYGVRATLVTTRFFCTSVLKHGNKKAPSTPSGHSHSIHIESISDGFDEGGSDSPDSFEAYLEKFRQVGSTTLAELIERMGSSGDPFHCVVYDSFLPWALEVAKKFGLIGAMFLTQSCSVNSFYFHVNKGWLNIPLSSDQTEISVPGVPPMEPCDMPSFLYVHEYYPSIREMLLDQFSNIDKADWVLSNTIRELEPEVTDWLGKLWPLKTIGPTVPSMFLDKRLPDDKDYGFTMFKSQSEECMKWLENKPKGSVVYVSFGSLAALDAEKFEELAWGLCECGSYFLWVVRESEKPKLPKSFLDNKPDKGLLVTWCPQLEVLAHEAVGCFVTHCGWNSTLEALTLGVPMVAVPQWSDQSTNAKYVKDVWKIGVKASVDEKGIARRNVIESCIREIMEGEMGREKKENAMKWKSLARKAADEGGSSDKNIADFVANLVSSL